MISGRKYQTIKSHQVKYKHTGLLKNNSDNGGNTFLGTGVSGIHMGVRNYLFATDKVIIRKDGKIVSAPVRTREE